MRILPVSDLHLEFYKFFPPPIFEKLKYDDIDVLVLAGDIFMARNSLQHIHLFAQKFKHVVYVAGNHEYYNAEFESIQRHLHAIGSENVHYLENESVEIEGRRFCGSTLWYSDFPDNYLYECELNDFYKIKHDRMKWNRFAYNYGKNSKAWLRNNVREGDIVVTHMLPSEACVEARYRGENTNRFYFNNCEDIIDANKPKLWIHGHSHTSLDMQIYDTRIIRNPCGYPGEFNPQFNPHLVIEV